MNRELKFRVWTGVEMEYKVVVGALGAFYAPKIDPTDSACIHTTTLYSENLPVMQFTGLKDRNGKEIFEGDILNCKGELYGENHHYKTTVPTEMIFGKPFGGTMYGWDIGWQIGQEVEVIGNIHQHPHLLEK